MSRLQTLPGPPVPHRFRDGERYQAHRSAFPVALIERRRHGPAAVGRFLPGMYMPAHRIESDPETWECLMQLRESLLARQDVEQNTAGVPE